MKFSGLHILITGGASGIGKAIAMQFSAMGNHIHIIDIADQMQIALEDIAFAAKSEQQTFSSHHCDVTNYEQVIATLKNLKEMEAVPAVLINCAGIAYPGYFEEIPTETFIKVMQINYFGTVHMIKAALPYIKEHSEGYIVNVSSLAALISIFGYTAYGASKFAVRGFSEALRMELKPHNIHVSMLCPPDTDTPQLKAENKIKPKETFVIADNVKPMTAAQVAACLIKNMKRKKFLILPGLPAKVFTFLNRIFPNISVKVMERQLRNYYKKQN